MATAPRYILTLSCQDRVGIVAAVASFLAAHDGFILESQQHADLETGRFFMRVEFGPGGPRFPEGGAEALAGRFAPIGAHHAMRWELADAAVPLRTLILVSRFGHCLNDLLHRWRTGALGIAIPAVVSNHDDFRGLAEWHGIPFHHMPVSAGTKPAAEARLLDLIDRERIELIVLARYMQVLSPALCERLAGRVVNIHHSFLPSFKGARPYHQAHERGVKLIGATAHYVTADLDEGPIIEQAAERVDHSHSADELAALGRDTEALVLARAVKWIAERRVLLNGPKTVVFRR